MSHPALWDLKLEEGEVVLWDQQSSRLRSFLLCLAVLGVLFLAGWTARNELVTAREAITCATDDCAIGHGKARLVFLISPILGLLTLMTMILVLLVKNWSALTNRRILSLHGAIWRRSTRYTFIRLEDAVVSAGRAIVIRGKSAKKEIWVHSWTKKSDAKFLAAFEVAKKNRLEDIMQCPAP